MAFRVEAIVTTGLCNGMPAARSLQMFLELPRPKARLAICEKMNARFEGAIGALQLVSFWLAP